MIDIHIREWTFDRVAGELGFLFTKQDAQEDLEPPPIETSHHEFPIFAQLLRGLQPFPAM